MTRQPITYIVHAFASVDVLRGDVCMEQPSGSFAPNAA